ncbi:hypothetical protein [Haladaptatus sp. NG-SE-30]
MSRDSYTVEVRVAGWSPTDDSSAHVPVVLQTPANDDPFTRKTSWRRPNAFTQTTAYMAPNTNGNIEVTLPPASIAKLDTGKGASWKSNQR